MNIFQKLGKSILNFLGEFGQIIILIFNVIKFLPRIFKDRNLVLEQMGTVGADSLPLVLLIGSFTGVIAALQATSLFDKFNLLALAKPFIGASIATAVFTELAPVLTALVIAGRIGASMTAQIGSMNVTEQIDALEMMGIDKHRFLGMPRIVATIVMLPILVVFANVVALSGAFILSMVKFEFSLVTFFDSIQRYFSISEIGIALFKSAFFGGITSIVGIHVGFTTTGGAEGVGKSTVRSFTIAAATILIFDAIFGYLI